MIHFKEGRLRKVYRTVLGFLLIFIGLILSIPLVPGPGFVVIALGIVVLSEHFTWAKRLVDWAKRKIEGYRGVK